LSRTGDGALASAARNAVTRPADEPVTHAVGELSEPLVREHPSASNPRKTQPTHRVRATERS
jgi:hypothetical protein